MKWLKVAKREYLERVRKKSFLIGTILGPLLMGSIVLVPGLLFERSTVEQTTIAVIDSTGFIFAQLNETLGDTLEDGTRLYNLSLVDMEGKSIEQVKRRLAAEVEQDVLDGYLVIPANIVDQDTATMYSKHVGAVKMFKQVEWGLSQAVREHRLSDAGMDYELVRSMLKNVDLGTVQVRKGEEKGSSEFLVVYLSTFVFIMMLYMTILLWGVAVQRSIIEEKNNRVIEVLLSSLNSYDLMTGKIFGVGFVGLTQYAIWSLFAVIISLYGLSAGVPIQLDMFSWMTLVFFVIFYVLGFLFYATIFAGIGSVCNTDQEAQQLQTPVVMCLVFTIIIPVAVIQNPEGMFATVVSLIPFFAPIVMFMRINVLTPPAWQIALSIAILVLSIFAASMIVAKVFRVGILMYGKRPDVREIFKWLKQA
jgi:ABC-2 type transport system permease protein